MTLRLQHYDFDDIHRPGKNNVVPVTFSRSVPVIDSVNDNCGEREQIKHKWCIDMVHRISENSEKNPLCMIKDGKLHRKTKLRYPD